MPLWHICLLGWVGVSLFIHSLLFAVGLFCVVASAKQDLGVLAPDGLAPLSCGTLGVCDPQGQKIKKKIRIMFLCFKNYKKLNEWYGSMG